MDEKIPQIALRTTRKDTPNMKKQDLKPRRVRRIPNDQAPYFFHQGTNVRAYDYLGARRVGNRFVFRVWAPNADFVSVCGDFTDWKVDLLPMWRVTENGVWEVSVESIRVRTGDKYKFFIRNGSRELYKADPYGLSMETPPGTASVICDPDSYVWRDEGWLAYRREHFTRETAHRQPINIYELHAGSWRRHEGGSFFSYTELASELVTYVKQMGYTHIELMPLAEHPFDGSWGYQTCGYFAPTSRYGSPFDLMSFIDTMHEAGIGVILDWVPAHFPKDEHGLCEFDGQPLYEYASLDRMEHPIWGTRFFDLGREEVQSFLLSSASFWVDKYHVDGLRVDAVASMLYLDFDRAPGEWTPNRYGDNRNLEAFDFFRKLNGSLARDFPDVMTFAEDSSVCRGITDFSHGGLGFTFKWNLGWMNDTLSYISEDPLFRKYRHHKLNFPLTYAFDEHFVLPVSHDEVVHGKRSLLDRAPGEYEQKFAGTRAFLVYQMTYPGKKLTFMGNEIGQFTEWDHEKSVEWFLLDYGMHAAFQLFAADLNHFYLSHAALWQKDTDPSGFEWIDADNAEQSICSYRRIDEKGRELIVVINFTPVERSGFLLAVPYDGVYEEIFNSDDPRYGGRGVQNLGKLRSEPTILRTYRHAIRITLPASSALILRRSRKASKRK